MNLLSDRISLILEENPGLSQKALGDAAGANRQLANHWLSGEVKSINIRHALNIESTLGYNHVWVMLGEGEKRILKQTYNENISHVLEVMQRMEPYQIDQTIKIIDAIAPRPATTSKFDTKDIDQEIAEIGKINEMFDETFPNAKYAPLSPKKN